MKNSKIALLIFCLVTMASYGQTEKGNVMISANTGINFASFDTEINNTNVSENTDFSIGGVAGYFLLDNLAAGISLGYNSSKTSNQKVTSFSIGPVVKYYFLKGKIKPFVETSYTFGQLASDLTFTDPLGFPTEVDFETDQRRFQSDAGVAFFINKVVSVELSVGYFSQTIDEVDNNTINVLEQKTSGFVSRVGFSIFL